MEPFRQLEAVAAPMPAANVDTDQILPARFLPRLRAEGLGPCLFRDQRFDDDGEERAGFVLNLPAYRDARILVAGRNFGCGSSRESAVYALYDFGIRSVIAPSFGDIFSSNCIKNGLLPVVLPEAAVTDLLRQITDRPGARVAVDLESQSVAAPDGARWSFEIDPMSKDLLTSGIDEIDYTLRLDDRIRAFERRRRPTVADGAVRLGAAEG